MRTFLLFLVCWVVSSVVTRISPHKLSQLHGTLRPGRGSGGFPPVLQSEQGRRAFRDQPALPSGTDPPVASGVPHGPRLLCEATSSGPVARVSRLSICPSSSLRSGCCPLPLDSRVALQVRPPGRLLPRVWTDDPESDPEILAKGRMVLPPELGWGHPRRTLPVGGSHVHPPWALGHGP